VLKGANKFAIIAGNLYLCGEMTNETRHFPACFVALPPSCEGRRAAFYLAAEEWIACHLPEDNYLMTWQLGRTVVMGRNQVAHQEVDIDFCRKNGIDIIRRKSGGGAIFADEGNIMVSLITGPSAVEPLFQEYAQTVAQGLRQLGAPTEVSGRNDVVLTGKGKICGNAFYHQSNRNIVHGTMLYDTQPALMEGALHPDVSKLKEKGVKSVRSRVALLKDFLPLSVTQLREELRRLFTNRTIALTAPQVSEIEALEQAYYQPDYLFGSSAGDEVTLGRRIEGCGTLNLHFRLQGSLVSNVRLSGDYFELGDAAAAFAAALTGIPFTPESLAQAIRERHPERSIRNLSEEALLTLIRL